VKIEQQIRYKISQYVENYIYPGVFIHKSRFDVKTPYCVHNSKTNRILRKFSTYKQARRYASAYGVDDILEQEMIVWIRVFGYLPKDDIIVQLKNKFHITAEYANRLFYLAFPDYVSNSELQRISQLQNDLLFASSNDEFEFKKAYTNVTVNGFDLNFGAHDVALFTNAENLFIQLLHERSIL
jgi:hypothetical protein